eukprot:s2839_g2.t1
MAVAKAEKNKAPQSSALKERMRAACAAYMSATAIMRFCRRRPERLSDPPLPALALALPAGLGGGAFFFFSSGDDDFCLSPLPESSEDDEDESEDPSLDFDDDDSFLTFFLLSSSSSSFFSFSFFAFSFFFSGSEGSEALALAEVALAEAPLFFCCKAFFIFLAPTRAFLSQDHARAARRRRAAVLPARRRRAVVLLARCRPAGLRAPRWGHRPSVATVVAELSGSPAQSLLPWEIAIVYK